MANFCVIFFTKNYRWPHLLLNHDGKFGEGQWKIATCTTFNSLCVTHSLTHSHIDKLSPMLMHWVDNKLLKFAGIFFINCHINYRVTSPWCILCVCIGPSVWYMEMSYVEILVIPIWKLKNRLWRILRDKKDSVLSETYVRFVTLFL